MNATFGITLAYVSLAQVLQSRFNFALHFEIMGFQMIVNYGTDLLRFPVPALYGSEIQARTQVKSVQKSLKGATPTLEVNIPTVGG